MKPPASTREDADPHLDNIQLLLQRRAELARNKAKYTLTENDAQLLCTHSTEVLFTDGQTIVEEGKDITSVYRIRAGKVVISRFGFQYNMIGRGWFIGDCMLLYGAPVYRMNNTMVAKGPVILDQLNLNFVQQIFNVDPLIKTKFYRYLVQKYSAIFVNVLHDLTVASKAASSSNTSTASLLTASYLSRRDSSSSLNSDDGSSQASDTSSDLGAPPTPTPTPTPPAVTIAGTTADFSRPGQLQHHHLPHLGGGHHLRKRGQKPQNAAYKSYVLVSKGGGIPIIQVKNKKLVVVSKSFGFSFKTHIEYTKIQSLDKVGELGATMIYHTHKIANIFFKNYYDREEFFGIATSLIANPPPSIETPIHTANQPLTIPHNPHVPYDEVPLCGGEEHLCQTHQKKLFLKKGDVVFAEGDLFQRVYTMLRGHLEFYQGTKKVCTMEEGEVFGVSTLLYLRPVSATGIVASETADMVYITAHDLNKLLETDIERAANFFQAAAITVDHQIGRAIGYFPHHKRLLREQSESGALRSERSDSSLSNSNLSQSSFSQSSFSNSSLSHSDSTTSLSRSDDSISSDSADFSIRT